MHFFFEFGALELHFGMILLIKNKTQIWFICFQNFLFVVVVCLQGRCNREKPPCKYFHPPQHLKDQLLINGRNHLALKNALMLQMGMAPAGQSVLPGQIPTIVRLISVVDFSSSLFLFFLISKRKEKKKHTNLNC